MASNVEPSHASSRPYYQAEHYSLAEAARRYRRSPDDIPYPPATNYLLVGYPGVGKTMALKKICYDLLSSESHSPVYLQVEPWIASVAAHDPAAYESSSSVLGQRLATTSRILLALGILTEIARQVSNPEPVLRAGLNSFSAPPTDMAVPSDGEKVLDWIDEQVAICREVLDFDKELPSPYTRFPPLFGFAQRLAAASKRSGRTLVLLLDQVERTSPVYFDSVSSLLRRGEYIVLVATRPCPSAPHQSKLPAGHDFRIHWLGSDYRKPQWRTFLNAVITYEEFTDDVRRLVERRREAISSLVGPSTRLALELLMSLEVQLHRAQSDQAWDRAVVRWREENIQSAGVRISGHCESPVYLLSRLRDQCLNARTAADVGPGPIILHIRPIAKHLTRRTEDFIRVCVREGLLIPANAQRHGLDTVLHDFEVQPLLATLAEPSFLSQFSALPQSTTISEQDLLRWVRAREPAPIESDVIFVSYWMTEESDADHKPLPDMLDAQLLGRAQVITGTDLPPNAVQYAPAIRQLIVRHAKLVIVDLSAQRREIYVEWGWAIGGMKRVILCCEDNLQLHSLPAWVRDRQVRLYGPRHLATFVNTVIKSLDTNSGPIEKWQADPTLRDLRVAPDWRTSAVIGMRGDQLEEVRRACSAASHAVALDDPLVVELSIPTPRQALSGDLLFDIILACRSAARLILVFSGDEEADLLLAVAGGIFSAVDTFTAHGVKHTRRLLVYVAGDPSAPTVPSLLLAKPGTKLAAEIGDVRKTVHDWIQRERALASQRS